MTKHDETHEVDFTDKKTSRYESGLELAKYGYLALTVTLGIKWLLTYTGLVPDNSDKGLELEMAWVAWTAGLIGVMYGKNSK